MTTAILDFGTNTFNLLIAREGEIIHVSKQAAKLGRGGIEKGYITPEAFERGMGAIANHMETIREFGASQIHAFATSAMRNASNGEAFVEEAYRRFGFRTEIIGGDREAELIWKGVSQTYKMGADPVMILDIGGGSNEFIICNQDGVLWKQSFELGMARMLERFQLSDPIRPAEIGRLEAHYEAELQPLFEAVKRFSPSVLLGASGTFDTLFALMHHRGDVPKDRGDGRELPMEACHRIYRDLIASTTAERMGMPGMEAVRVEMIVAATIFVSFVMERCRLKELHHSAFALKEGVIAEMTGNKS